MQDTSEDMSNAENFKNVFKPYLIKWSIVYAVLITFITFITLCIPIRSWVFSQWLVSWLMDKGATFDGKNIHYSVITLGAVTYGIVSVGINGGGVFVFGGNVVGVVAIGCNAVGVIAIGCNAVGVVAIGHGAFGFYVFGYTNRSKGRYMLAPQRQDTEAIDFFSRWFPKLTESLSTH